MAHYPEERLDAKTPAVPRHKGGMTQVHPARKQPPSFMPKGGMKVKGHALVAALKGMKNRRHPHDGSK